jgi:putative hydrolase of the HAD superfamily
MVHAVLFDMGGTLDGDGEHWLDRFIRLYTDARVALPREVIRKGFDHAERRAAAEAVRVSAGLEQFVRQHLAWQTECHTAGDAALLERIAEQFISLVRAAAKRSVPVLAELRRRGLLLGVVSNGCGNVQILCDEFGFSRFLDCVIDSHWAGVAKPDPAIFRLALDRLGVTAASTLMVGDSYDRDIVPAHRIGMHTAWLMARNAGVVPGVADAVIGSLDALLPLFQQPERMPA